MLPWRPVSAGVVASMDVLAGAVVANANVAVVVVDAVIVADDADAAIANVAVVGIVVTITVGVQNPEPLR